MMRPNHTFKHLIDEGFRPFRKDAVVWAKQMDEPFEVPTPAGPMHGEAGDYWCIGLRNQQWLSQAAVFEQIYKPVWHPAGSEAYLMNAAALPYLQAGYSSSIATATSHPRRPYKVLRQTPFAGSGEALGSPCRRAHSTAQ
jgi:hypothetical protein